MKLRKIALGLLGGAAILISVGLSTSARAQINLKVSVQEMTLKKKPSAQDRKNSKSFARDVDKKVLDERTLSLTFGTPKELALPNGSKLILNASSFSAETKKLKIHVRMQISESGYETDASMLQGRRYPVNAGHYGQKSVLVVYVTPQAP